MKNFLGQWDMAEDLVHGQETNMKSITEKINEQEVIENPIQIKEDLSYDDIIQKLQEAKENNLPIEEGILGAIGGVVLGTSFGPKLGGAICKALGVDPKGTLGSLITSKLVMGSIGGVMGWKL